ncbi:unnamed protein product, partial [Haemonchus placei]
MQSTKLRIVFDVPSHAKGEYFFNDGISNSARKAFLQIRLPKEHGDVARLLWNDHVYFRFCRVPFGIEASSAFSNQSVLKHIEQSQSSIASELSNPLYVNNVLLEGRTAEELIRKYTES